MPNQRAVGRRLSQEAEAEAEDPAPAEVSESRRREELVIPPGNQQEASAQEQAEDNVTVANEPTTQEEPAAPAEPTEPRRTLPTDRQPQVSIETPIGRRTCEHSIEYKVEL